NFIRSINLGHYRPKCGPKQDRNFNSLFGRENSLFFAENSLFTPKNFPACSTGRSNFVTAWLYQSSRAIGISRIRHGQAIERSKAAVSYGSLGLMVAAVCARLWVLRGHAVPANAAAHHASLQHGGQKTVPDSILVAVTSGKTSRERRAGGGGRADGSQCSERPEGDPAS